MSLEISEDLVSLAYQSLGYFVSEGRKVGYGEVDLLAIKLGAGGEVEERLHVEVQIGTRPIGVLSGKSGSLAAAKDSAAAAQEWVQKKYRAPALTAELTKAFGGQPYRCVFVHAVMKDPKQLEAFGDCEIECVHIRDLIQRAMAKGRPNRLHRAVSIARMLTE
jgi:hypothetical protein